MNYWKKFDTTSFLLGMAAVMIVNSLRRVTLYERCPYQFPHSGQCVRANHHAGEHW